MYLDCTLIMAALLSTVKYWEMSETEDCKDEPMDQNEDELIEEDKDNNRKSGEWRAADLEHEQATAKMTASYSKISFEEQDKLQQTSQPNRPHSLLCNTSDKPLDLDGLVLHDGNMTHFVADDLEYRIKLCSPVSKKAAAQYFDDRSTFPNTSRYRQSLASQIGQVDITVLNDLENEARRIAQSVDYLIENLSSILHSNSSITADNIEVYKDAVSKTCDAMDSNIKSMYTILAKGEEVSQAMIPVQAHAARISELKRLLHLFESNI